MEDGFNYQTAIEEFQDERPVWKQIWAAIITEFTPDKKNWFGAAFSFVLALILTIIIARSEETVSLAGKSAAFSWMLKSRFLDVFSRYIRYC